MVSSSIIRVIMVLHCMYREIQPSIVPLLKTTMQNPFWVKAVLSMLMVLGLFKVFLILKPNSTIIFSNYMTQHSLSIPANQGAGIFSDDMQIVIEESNFHQNTATTGVGIYQKASQTSILSSFIEENEADIGTAFYLADSTSQLQNRLSCSDGSYIMSNISENTSAAVSIDGDSLLLIEDCFFGSNVSENTNDIQHQEALLMSSISLGWEGHCDAWSCMEQEACNQGLDSNYNGLIGWDDPTCQFELTQNIVPNQLIADIYDPPFSCYDSSATILQGPDVLQLYTAPTSGCIHVTTDFQGQYGSLISLFDEEQEFTDMC